MKPVFIIAIVAVAMIGVMVPNVFADHIDVDSLIPDFPTSRDATYSDPNWIFRHAVDKVGKYVYGPNGYSTPDEELLGYVYIFQMDSNESAIETWDHWSLGREIVAAGKSSGTYGSTGIEHEIDDYYNIKYSKMYENTLNAKCKAQIPSNPGYDPYTMQLVEQKRMEANGFSCLKHDMIFLFDSPEALDIISQKYLLQKNPMIKDAQKINSDSIDNSLAITNNLKELSSTTGISLGESRDLEKYVDVRVAETRYMPKESEHDSFFSEITSNTVYSFKQEYSNGFSRTSVLIQQFQTNENAIKYNEHIVNKLLTQTEYWAEEMEWWGAPDECKLYADQKRPTGWDNFTTKCVIDNYRILVSSTYGDEEIAKKFTKAVVDKFYEYTPKHTFLSTSTSEESKGGGCLIATATYGSELSNEVQQLRELRDNTLLNTESGTAFMGMFNDVYYSFSPVISDYERENPYFKEAVKLAITPLISSLSVLNYVDMDSESEVLGYGISLILLNLGMYLGVPAVVIVGIRKIKSK